MLMPGEVREDCPYHKDNPTAMTWSDRNDRWQYGRCQHLPFKPGATDICFCLGCFETGIGPKKPTVV